MVTIGEVHGLNKRPRWADLADSSAEQLPELPSALRDTLSRTSAAESQAADADSLDALRGDLSRTLSEVRDANKRPRWADLADSSVEQVPEPPAKDCLAPASPQGPPRKRLQLRASASPAGMTGLKACTPTSQRRRLLRKTPPSFLPQARSPAAAMEAGELNGSEEEWQRRATKRRAIVEVTKELPAYKARRARRLQSDAADSPRTPDPEDRQLSKRTWEKMIAEWRLSIKDTLDVHGDTELVVH